jgi:hypothetical protein
MTDTLTPLDAGSCARWVFVDTGLWAGSAGGSHLGRIEAFGRRFRAIDGRGSWLGDYPTLEIAQRIVGWPGSSDPATGEPVEDPEEQPVTPSGAPPENPSG